MSTAITMTKGALTSKNSLRVMATRVIFVSLAQQQCEGARVMKLYKELYISSIINIRYIVYLI